MVMPLFRPLSLLRLEQVDANGFSWRSGAKVEKLNLKQWFLKITAFKEALLDDLDLLHQWPERVTTMQRNWLGRSKGAKIKFNVVDNSGNADSRQPINVFTTRPDTLLGVQYLCLSAKHPLVAHLSEQDEALANFVNSLNSLPADSKQGYRLQGVYAKNPLRSLDNVPDSSTEEPLPIYVSPYVVDNYGEGAVMGVPAHDSRDWEFWKQNAEDVPPRQVIFPNGEEVSESSTRMDKVFTGAGVLGKSYGKYAGLGSEEAAQVIVSDLSEAGGHAQSSETWKLRDWLISRQRYWGTPIPIVHCDKCGAVPVPVDQLPVELPKIDGSSLKHRTGNPLDHAHDWVNTACPTCSGPAKRDTDTMDTFMDSSWYMFRFTDSNNESEPFSSQLADSNMPVDVYLGGVEHAILHLLYARFIAKFLATTSFWPAGAAPDVRGEPFRQQISQGMVHGKTFSDPDTGRFLRQDEVDLSVADKPKIIANGKEPVISFEKMSKSKHNGVDPLTVIDKYGADVTRAHMLFQAPVSEILEWEEDRISGIQRWLARVWRLVQGASVSLSKQKASKPRRQQPFPFRVRRFSKLSDFEKSLKLATQRTASSITTSLSTTHTLNTCISDLMSLTNTIVQPPGYFESLYSGTVYHTCSNLLRLLAPFTPAFAEECWQMLHSNIPYPYLPQFDRGAQQDPNDNGDTSDIQNSIFKYSVPLPYGLAKLEAWAAKDKQTCAVMENGKLRVTIEIEPIVDGLSETEREERVLDQLQKTQKGAWWLERAKQAKGSEKWWKKIIVVKGGKTVNFVG